MKNIEELLEKYWNAETTIEEEKQLKAYFQSNDVDDQHKAYSTLFSYFDEESQLKSDFNPLFKVEALAATPNNNTSIQKETKVISLVSRWRAVAALLIFALASLWVVNIFLKPTEQKEEVVANTKKARIIEINDVDEAMAYTEDAMNLISSLLKTGTDQVITGMEKIDNSPVIGLQ